MTFKSYSTTAASNNAAAPDGAPEGMAASGVNNALRELMARAALNWASVDVYDATDTGSANVYTIQLTGTNVDLTAGMCVRFKAANTNTSASSLTINALTQKDIRKVTTAGVVALTAGDIQAGGIVTVVYDGTYFQLVTPSAVAQALSAVTATATELNEYTLTLDIADGSADATYYLTCPHAGTISKIYSVIDGVVSTADITITANIGATPVTNGAITIAQSGSAAGDVDSCTPTAANTVSAGAAINLVVAGGGSGGAPRIHVAVVISR